MRRNNRMNPMSHDRRPQPQFQIQDLDRELELLQRKRQMLEQGQHGGGDSYYPQPFQNQSQQGPVRVWDAAPNNFGQGDNFNYEYNRNRGPQEYNRAPQGYRGGGGGGGRGGRGGTGGAGGPGYGAPGRANPRKRPADSWQEPQPRFPARVWDNGNAPKFGGPSFAPSPAKRANHPQKKFQPSPQPRGFKSAAPRDAPRPVPTRPNKPFVKKPGFVPKANDAPQAQPKPKHKAAAPNTPYHLYVVQPNTFLPNAVMGRIEQAVGQVWKEFRARNADHPKHSSFSSPGVASKVKNAIRERIKQALAGKPLGEPGNVLVLYQKEFPESADEELIQLCIEAEKQWKEKADRGAKSVYMQDAMKADSALEYFNLNMNKALKLKMDEILYKVAQIYKDKLPTEEKLVAKVQEIIDAEKTKADADQTTEDATDDITEDTTEDTNQETAEEAPAETEVQEETITDVQAVDAETADNAEVTEEQQNEGTEAEKQLKRYEELMEILIKKSLPKILYSFKDKLVSIVRSDDEFSFAPDMLRWRARNMDHGDTAQQVDPIGDPMPPTTYVKRNAIYHVMVMGVPHLPRKQRLRAFLDSFNPASIKKHRDVRNVLFVGFSQHRDYVNILNKNNVIMGDNRISIKPNKKNNEISAARAKKAATSNSSEADNTKATEATEATEASEEMETEATEASEDMETETTQNGEENNEQTGQDHQDNVSDDKIIDSDLDGQINDLLEACGDAEEDKADEAIGGDEVIGDEANGGDDVNIDNEANVEEANGDGNGEVNNVADEYTEADGTDNNDPAIDQSQEEPTPVEEEKPVESRPKRVAAARKSVSAPMTPTKAKATPAKATPAKATPAKATPAKATPVAKGTPVAKTNMAKRGGKR